MEEQQEENLKSLDFLNGLVIKNLPANAIPSQEDCTCHGIHAPALQLLKATCPRACAASTTRKTHISQLRNPERSNEDPAQPEMSKYRI